MNAAETRAQELVAAERARVEVLLREMGSRRDQNDQRVEPQQVSIG